MQDSGFYNIWYLVIFWSFIHFLIFSQQLLTLGVDMSWQTEQTSIHLLFAGLHLCGVCVHPHLQSGFSIVVTHLSLWVEEEGLMLSSWLSRSFPLQLLKECMRYTFGLCCLPFQKLPSVQNPLDLAGYQYSLFYWVPLLCSAGIPVVMDNPIKYENHHPFIFPPAQSSWHTLLVTHLSVKGLLHNRG